MARWLSEGSPQKKRRRGDTSRPLLLASSAVGDPAGWEGPTSHRRNVLPCWDAATGVLGQASASRTQALSVLKPPGYVWYLRNTVRSASGSMPFCTASSDHRQSAVAGWLLLTQSYNTKCHYGTTRKYLLKAYRVESTLLKTPLQGLHSMTPACFAPPPPPPLHTSASNFVATQIHL